MIDLIPFLFALLILESLIAWAMFFFQLRISKANEAICREQERSICLLRDSNHQQRQHIIKLAKQIRDYSDGEGWKRNDD